MSFSIPVGDAPRPRRTDDSPRRRRMSPLSVVGLVLGVLIVVLVLASEIVTRYLWFDQIGYDRVLVTSWVAQAVLFAIGAVLAGLPLLLSLRIPFRTRPIFPPVTREQEALEQFRASIEPLRVGITIVAPIVVGVFGGLAASRAWQQALLLLHPESFGATDPLFGNDVSFYVFTLPMIDMGLAFGRYVVIVALVGALMGHFVYGGIAWEQTAGLSITAPARRHVGILAALFLVLLGASHWFERFGLLTGSHAKFDGASYTDVHAILPAKSILAIAALIVAAMFVVWVVRGDIRIPVIGAAVMFLSTLAVGVAYPALVQQFKVEPNERILEQPYIQRNIDATRSAFGLDDIAVVPYQATTDAAPGALRADAETTTQIRLLDPAVIAPTFIQREAPRNYWSFDSVLSVDRYAIDGKLQDTVIGVRELRPDRLNLQNLSWVNQHITYTHGFGAVAAYGNHRSASGEPEFLESGVPSSGALGDYEQRVYFGRHSPDYSIVGAPEGAPHQEFDYQATTDDQQDGRQVTNTFTGDGGPSLRNPLVRLLYAIKFRDPNVVISSYVNDESQVLYDRDPQARVKAVAPYLSLDSGMYPAVVDGRLVWVVDGYTSTSRYPYSRAISLDGVVRDSQTDPAQTSALRSPSANYLRNGVKATVDAYDGSVTLYAWDTEDPILRAWQEIFPGELKPVSDISSDLMQHLRYPEDMFKAQRALIARYHVTEPDAFYGEQDFWQVPKDPTRARTADPQGAAASDDRPAQPPHYLTLQMPGQDSPRFSLSSSFEPYKEQQSAGQQVLSGFLAVDSETGDAAGAPAESYGKLTLLTLPASNPVNGPGQVQATFNSNPDVSRALNLLKSGNSEVINGNLLTLPVGGGLLYVQPVYLQSSAAGGGTQYPLLQMVLVSFGSKIGFASTLDQALDEVFGGDSGAAAGDAGLQDGGPSGAVGTDSQPADQGATDQGATDQAATPTDQASPAPSADPSAAPTEEGDPKQRLDRALADMQTAEDDANAALAAGDFQKYGEAQDRLAEALDRAVAASKDLDAQTGGSSTGG
ncbi:UPF0182 family membrane protein [Brachybacterium huguangmaarense]